MLKIDEISMVSKNASKVMWQCGDAEFIDLLNHIHVAELDNSDLEILKSKFIFINSVNYPRDALHILAHNAPAAAHNTAMLWSNINELHSIEAIGILPKNIPAACEKCMYTTLF